MRLYSPRHLSRSRGLRWLARLWAMPLSVGMAALVGILLLLAGLATVTVNGSPSPTSRRGTATTGSPAATSLARNLVADSGFDHDVAAWRPLPGAFLTRGSAATPANHARVQRDPSTPATTDPKTGRALYGMVLPVIRSAAVGMHVDATVQIRATRAQVPVLLRLSELAGGRTAARSEVRAVLTDTAWHLLKVDRKVGTAGAAIQVEVGALALRPDEAVYVDNVRVSSRP
jgi:predicted lipid-binding transport protein (Tim44 family)